MKCPKGFTFGLSCDKMPECFDCEHVIWSTCKANQKSICEVCGRKLKMKFEKKNNRCSECGKWFAEIKCNLWNNGDRKLYYKLRKEGKL